MRTDDLIPWRRSRQMQPAASERTPFLFSNDVSRFFDEMFTRPPGLFEPFGRETSGFGAIDMAERDNAFVLTVDLPGVDDNDVDLELAGNRLLIRARRERNVEDDEDGLQLVERSFGAFTRQLLLPDDVDANKVAADLKNGVLTITAPKTEDAQERVRKIRINR